jgi:hypothetical protein
MSIRKSKSNKPEIMNKEKFIGTIGKEKLLKLNKK